MLLYFFVELNGAGKTRYKRDGGGELLLHRTECTCHSTLANVLLVVLRSLAHMTRCRCVWQESVPPIVSFHFGSLGFLSPFDFKNYQPKIAQVLGGESPPLDRCLCRTPGSCVRRTPISCVRRAAVNCVCRTAAANVAHLSTAWV